MLILKAFDSSRFVKIKLILRKVGASNKKSRFSFKKNKMYYGTSKNNFIQQQQHPLIQRPQFKKKKKKKIWFPRFPTLVGFYIVVIHGNIFFVGQNKSKYCIQDSLNCGSVLNHSYTTKASSNLQPIMSIASNNNGLFRCSYLLCGKRNIGDE